MTREIIGFVMVASVLLIALLVGIGYRRKRLLETDAIAPFQDALDCSGANCLYVSTVFSESPLKRILAHGMGPRGRATVAITNEGVSICRKGERSFLIPKSAFVGVEKSTATIDRAVEPGGLTSIAWNHDGQILVTNLRFESREEREMFEKEVAV